MTAAVATKAQTNKITSLRRVCQKLPWVLDGDWSERELRLTPASLSDRSESARSGVVTFGYVNKQGRQVDGPDEIR